MGCHLNCQTNTDRLDTWILTIINVTGKGSQFVKHFLIFQCFYIVYNIYNICNVGVPCNIIHIQSSWNPPEVACANVEV